MQQQRGRVKKSALKEAGLANFDQIKGQMIANKETKDVVYNGNVYRLYGNTTVKKIATADFIETHKINTKTSKYVEYELFEKVEVEEPKSEAASTEKIDPRIAAIERLKIDDKLKAELIAGLS